MSLTRSQALIEASPTEVWELVGDPRHHPEWWPRIVEVRGEKFAPGSEYVQVTKSPMGRQETTMEVDRLEELRHIDMHCTDTGTFARWSLTEARGDTFVDVEFGMDPSGAANQIFDGVFGKVYFRRWLSQSLDALQAAAKKRQPASR
jgi:uncharacterized protein YndB with AHSA1/START domain